ncbi:nucleolar pre-ribosomal-associated protein 2 [Geosmithia morbida]|uniref:Nucleolar pre-ribosomal-associated protein 2 n=1 Tax=Geosmithia morbida TaxID=1094350 RepID=A0A9P5D258_9HYPO|nr:nucleolar pre-ribosomal-associated protein 2 [Geosmithia morbida]KAF4121156.1 nucleolar pre-ribosomal-associated protein 2 [Geosmithia morbida]
MANDDLIKTVRGLDQNGPGQDGANLDRLWTFLTASSDSQFHAAEESSLRWLLKSMNGSTPAAETLRRYPLTWRLMACVFQRIPLFSLAKSLADRRFIAVLQQSLKDVSAPVSESRQARASSKRKRAHISFSLEDLRSADGCAEGIKAVFEALSCLMRRTEGMTNVSARDRIGAEHLKSLFGGPAGEATAIVAPLLRMCHTVLTVENTEELDGCEDWIEIIALTWDLHLQGNDDVYEVAQNLLDPAAVVLGDVEESTKGDQTSAQRSLTSRWRTDLTNFLHRILILPSRSIFLNHQNDKAIVTALDGSEKHLAVAAPAIYALASSATEALVLRGVRKGNAEWMKKVFETIDSSLGEREDRSAIMKTILRKCRELAMPVDTGHLRSVCKRYALHDGETDWDLVANLAQCDPDVFQGDDDGAGLLKEVCRRSLHVQDSNQAREALSDVISAIMRGFRTARDFPAFLRLWFRQLSELTGGRSKLASRWMLVGQETSPSNLSELSIEQHLSTRQLTEILGWAEAQEADPKTLCLWLNGISCGLNGNEYKDAAYSKLSDIILKISKSTSDITALKWRVVARTFSWAPATKRSDIWGAVRGTLAKILKKTPVNSAETYEAFKCCTRIWVSSSPDGEQVSEASDIVEKFTVRLAQEIISSGIPDDRLSSYLESRSEPSFDKDAAFQQYLVWYMRGSTRLNRLYFEKKAQILPTVQDAVSDAKAKPQRLELLWTSLLDNEHCINKAKLAEDVITRAIDALVASKKSEKQWPGELGQLWIRLLSRLPLDAVTRPQRERIMDTLLGGFTLEKSQDMSLEGWRLVLSIAAKLMTRPTFFTGLNFGQLAGIADAISTSPATLSSDEDILEELIGRYSTLASATIRQMVIHMEERSAAYFEEASKFASRYKAKDVDSRTVTPLYLTLLKEVVTEVTKSPNAQSHKLLKSLCLDARTALEALIAAVVKDWTGDKKLMSKPTAEANLRLSAAVDASDLPLELPGLRELGSSGIRRLEKRSLEAMRSGHLRGWKLQTFLQGHMSQKLDSPRQASFPSLKDLGGKSRERHLKEYIDAVVSSSDGSVLTQYLEVLINEYNGGCGTDGQLMAIGYIIDHLIRKFCLTLSTYEKKKPPENQKMVHPVLHIVLFLADSTAAFGTEGEFTLSAAYNEMTYALVSPAIPTANSVHICRILYTLLEKKAQAVSQWNIESLLDSIAVMCSRKSSGTSSDSEEGTGAPFIWLCKLVEVIVKKHRVRLEGHYHILLATMQPLLRNLIQEQTESRTGDDGLGQESKASAYGRLVTLVCEPTAGAVSRSVQHSTLDSATDAAKRSAGRHMYLIMMQYVKLQLETDVSRGVREALEPAMNAIFDITTPDGRKILNDAMDGSGRAILREMFKRYNRFGKWSGV